jgi:hypothetical protein
LQQTRPGIIPAYRHTQAQDLTQGLEQTHQGAIHERDLSVRNNASPLVAATGPYWRDTTANIDTRFDSDAAVRSYELPERYLINPVLLGIPALLLHHDSILNSILEDTATDAVVDMRLEQCARGSVECRDHEG